MSQQIQIEKRVFGKDFSKVIDTKFKQLGQVESLPNEISLEEFFQLYEKYFYLIPKEGDTNSHIYILNKEAEYLGLKLQSEEDLQALLDEITNLRQELLQANQVLSDNSLTIINTL